MPGFAPVGCHRPEQSRHAEGTSPASDLRQIGRDDAAQAVIEDMRPGWMRGKLVSQ